MLVIDASLALAWCFGDEKTPAADRAIDRVRDEGALVPSLWRLEVANVLFAAERRGRIDRTDLEHRLDLLAALPIVIDAETDLHAWTDTLLLARVQRLTVYDAAYLELAMRLGAELGTLDDNLARAAKRTGVPVAG
jgi:predicted nucleic acid-binding protein